MSLFFCWGAKGHGLSFASRLGLHNERHLTPKQPRDIIKGNDPQMQVEYVTTAVCLCLCICVYMQTCACIYIYIFIYIYISAQTYTYFCKYAYVCVCTQHMDIHGYLYINIYTYTYTYTYTYIIIYICVRGVRARVWSHVQLHLSTANVSCCMRAKIFNIPSGCRFRSNTRDVLKQQGAGPRKP